MYHKNSSTLSSLNFHRSVFVPNPVYPCYTESMVDLSQMSSTSTDYLSTGTSYDDLSSFRNMYTPNYRQRYSSSTAISNSRFKERLAASTAGLKELEVLREKHRKMIQEVKSRLNFSSSCIDMDTTTSAKFERDNNNTERVPSPAPSANEMSSNMSYRSSLSMDSGYVSIASDPSNHSTYNGEPSGVYYSLPPSRKSSTTTQPQLTSSYIPTTIPDTSDDEGCYPDAPTPQLSQSYTSIPNLAAAADPPPKPPIRYRRKGLIPPRPRSLYSYPEENTVTVQPSELSDSRVEVNCNTVSDKLYRANKIYITPRSQPSSLSSCSSMSSIPSCLRYAGRWSRPGSIALPSSPPPLPDARYHHNNRQDGGALFTWEQVKRLLDPHFDNRTLVRQCSNFNVNNTSKFDTTPSLNNKSLDERTTAGQTTVCSQEHIVVSRSVSGQSNDSCKLRKREKPWHESEHL